MAKKNIVPQSMIRWAIPQIANGEGELDLCPDEQIYIKDWVQDISNELLSIINPNFKGYVSHADEDAVVSRIVTILQTCWDMGINRPSPKAILNKWIDEDWAPIHMAIKD